jgi:hypothetical protein
MMRISEIEEFFKINVSKKELKEISLDNENSISLINSTKTAFDFDELNKKIKTSDTIYFNNNKIIFVEFKRGKVSDKDFRLKATESLISFYNFAFANGFKENLSFPNDNFHIYIVYDKNNSSPSKLNTFKVTERKLKLEYKHFFSKYEIIDNDKFKKIFRI